MMVDAIYSQLSSVVALIDLWGRGVLLVIFRALLASLSTTPKVGFYFAQYVPAGKKYEYEMQPECSP